MQWDSVHLRRRSQCWEPNVCSRNSPALCFFKNVFTAGLSSLPCYLNLRLKTLLRFVISCPLNVCARVCVCVTEKCGVCMRCEVHQAFVCAGFTHSRSYCLNGTRGSDTYAGRMPGTRGGTRNCVRVCSCGRICTRYGTSCHTLACLALASE